jgi:hypothetical protein
MFSKETIATLRLWAFGFWKIPMVFYCRPRFVEISKDKTVLKIKLKRKTQNHVNSMYVGAMVVGAELATLFPVFDAAIRMKKNIPPVVKDLRAEYYMRAMGDTYFTCEQNVEELLQEAITSGERINKEVTINATCPDINDDIVAKFVLTISVKEKKKRK